MKYAIIGIFPNRVSFNVAVVVCSSIFNCVWLHCRCCVPTVLSGKSIFLTSEKLIVSALSAITLVMFFVNKWSPNLVMKCLLY